MNESRTDGDIDGVIVEGRRDVLPGKIIGGVTDDQRGLAHGGVADDHAGDVSTSVRVLDR